MWNDEDVSVPDQAGYPRGICIQSCDVCSDLFLESDCTIVFHRKTCICAKEKVFICSTLGDRRHDVCLGHLEKYDLKEGGI